jgi:hypothetical protein
MSMAATVLGSGMDWYCMDYSGAYPKVMGRYSTQREAQRALLNTRDALLFDQGIPFAELGLEGVQPAP